MHLCAGTLYPGRRLRGRAGRALRRRRAGDQGTHPAHEYHTRIAQSRRPSHVSFPTKIERESALKKPERASQADLQVLAKELNPARDPRPFLDSLNTSLLVFTWPHSYRKLWSVTKEERERERERESLSIETLGLKKHSRAECSCPTIWPHAPTHKRYD